MSFDYLLLPSPGAEPLGRYFTRQRDLSFSPSVPNVIFFLSEVKREAESLMQPSEKKQKVSRSPGQPSSLLPTIHGSVGLCSPSQCGGGLKNAWGFFYLTGGLQSRSPLKPVVKAGALCNPQGTEV